MPKTIYADPKARFNRFFAQPSGSGEKAGEDNGTASSIVRLGRTTSSQ